MPGQLINQPGTPFQPPFSVQNPYPDSLQIPNQYQQQSQPPARNQDRQPQPYQNQGPRNGYQEPPVRLQPGSPTASNAPFVLPAARPSPRERKYSFVLICYFILTINFVAPVARQPDFYDDYINAYAEETPHPLVASSIPNQGQDRVALWPQGSAQPSPGILSSGLGVGSSIQRMPSRGPVGGYSQGPSSADAPQGADMVRNAGGASIRRKPTRRVTQRRPKPTYEEEEEGYVSGEYDEPYELMTIRVKVCIDCFLGLCVWLMTFVAVALSG